mmetsp:Transcript_5322/g.11004  ORF Transcript_5322/g.11004 Transcript_5322/m.11004 type:complete len:377 (+) Transcript_5322:18-1148(+)
MWNVLAHERQVADVLAREQLELNALAVHIKPHSKDPDLIRAGNVLLQAIIHDPSAYEWLLQTKHAMPSSGCAHTYILSHDGDATRAIPSDWILTVVQGGYSYHRLSETGSIESDSNCEYLAGTKLFVVCYMTTKEKKFGGRCFYTGLLKKNVSSTKSIKYKDDVECTSVKLVHMAPIYPIGNECDLSEIEELLQANSSRPHYDDVTPILQAHDKQISAQGEQLEDHRKAIVAMSCRLDGLECQQQQASADMNEERTKNSQRFADVDSDMEDIERRIKSQLLLSVSSPVQASTSTTVQDIICNILQNDISGEGMDKLEIRRKLQGLGKTNISASQINQYLYALESQGRVKNVGTSLTGSGKKPLWACETSKRPRGPQ